MVSWFLVLVYLPQPTHENSSGLTGLYQIGCSAVLKHTVRREAFGCDRGVVQVMLRVASAGGVIGLSVIHCIGALAQGWAVA